MTIRMYRDRPELLNKMYQAVGCQGQDKDYHVSTTHDFHCLNGMKGLHYCVMGQDREDSICFRRENRSTERATSWIGLIWKALLDY